MFSPSLHEGGPATATRSRRRQRPLSSDSLVQQPKAKRQRVPLTEQTFVNPDGPPEMFEVKSDKVATLGIRQDGIENFAVPKKDLQVRAKKPKAGDRASKGDGSIVLTSTNAFTVSKLPALPDRLRADSTSNQHGDIFSSGYALSLTHTHAVVWPYTSTTPSPETFTFTLPYPSKNAAEPLPLGSLVTPSASSVEPGLVVVMPVSGKITYWETISSAATLDFIRQQRHGVEDAIAGMYSGERVIQIANAESAGFILAFSTGRLAYMNVRDNHGRPLISTQFLRTSLGSTSGSIFGSIRHALSRSASRGDIAAVRVSRSQKVGERNVVAATLKGRFYACQVHRGGHYDTLADADLRDSIVSAIQEVDRSTQDFSADSFELLDFTFVPKGLEEKYVEMSRLSDALASDGGDDVQHILSLVSLTRKRESRYSLVEIVLSREGGRIGLVRPISSYSTHVSQSNRSNVVRPRLYLPRPALVAFLVFDRTVVVASIAVQPESPDSQLQEDNHIVPAMYEDVVDLRENDVLEIVGSGFEESPSAGHGQDESRAHRYRAKNPSVVLIVKGAGILRISTTDVDKFGSDKPPMVTAKSKLEQAVFFGVKADNPLVFDGRKERQFSHGEISEAALQLSHEILSSTTPHIATLPASLEDNLSSRVQALERLILHLRATKVELDHRTKWTLLWNAEKMMVATLLWKRQETFTAERPASDKKSLVGEIVEFIHEDQKKDPNRAVGQLDRVRHWFINDVWRLDLFVAWAYEVIKYMYKDHLLDDIRITRLLYEAVHINVCALLAAWEYRRTHLAAYGLEDEDMEMEILHSGYEGLPEPWTGSFYISNNIKRLVELCNQWLGQYFPPDPKAPNQPDPTLIENIAAEMPALTDLYLTSLLEQSRWAIASSDPKKNNWGQQCAKVYQNDREEKATSLAKRGQWDEGAAIAEKHRCWHGLAVLMIDHIQALNKAAAEPGLSPVDVQQRVAQAKAKEKAIENFFNKYGEVFAFEIYGRLLETDGVQSILDFSGDRQGFKTKFLRTRPELARISWINDIEREKDIDHAAETLLDLGLTREQQVWNKKIELSLGKLALMAEAEAPDNSIFAVARVNDETKHEAQLDKIDRELEVIKIQDQLYSQIFPTVSVAIDEAAELEIAMETHTLNIPKKQKTLMQIFEMAMRRLLRHEALDAMSLIDLLTLVWLRDEARDEIGDVFYLAILVAEHSLKGEDLKQASRLIWRRCFIRDDWSKINDTNLKNDPAVVDRISSTALFSLLVSCYSNRKSVDEPFLLFRPSEALGVYTDGLDSRFNDMEKAFRDKVIDAMKWEDTQLRKYIDKHRLEEWTRTTAESAEAAVREQVDEATMNGANGFQMEMDGVKTNGQAKNGH